MTPYYQDDAMTLYHGDAREVVPALDVSGVALVLTDPPYAISQAGVAHVRQPGKGRRAFDFFAGDSDWPAVIEMWRSVLAGLIDRLPAPASIYAWVSHREFGPTITMLEAAGFQTRFLVWNKKCPAPPPPGAGWPSAAELCVFGWRAGRVWTHNGNNPPPSNVLVADSYRYGQPGKVNHPTQKPERVIAPLVVASSREGDVVLDPFAGSGTTLAVCKQLGRHAIGVEIEERWCEVAARRLAQESLFKPTPRRDAEQLGLLDSKPPPGTP